MIKLIATDMDGTFLDDEKTYDHARFHALYQQLKERNVLFCIASGRQMMILKEDFADIADELLIIAENGAYIAQGNQIIYTQEMKEASYRAVVDTLSQYDNLVPVLSGMQHCYLLAKHQQYMPLILPYYHTIEIINDLQDIKDMIFKVSVLNTTPPHDPHEQDVARQLDDHLTTIVTGFEWYDVITKGTYKGPGLQQIQNHFHISPDETMIFGDEVNDLSLYDHATYSYAMANAAPSVKAIAHYEAPSNNEQGVLSVIEEYLKAGKI